MAKQTLSGHKPNLKRPGVFTGQLRTGYVMGSYRGPCDVGLNAEQLWNNLHKIENREAAFEWLGLPPEKDYPTFQQIADATVRRRNELTAEIAKATIVAIMPEMTAIITKTLSEYLGVGPQKTVAAKAKKS